MSNFIEEELQKVAYDIDDEDFNPNREPVISFSDAKKLLELQKQEIVEEIENSTIDEAVLNITKGIGVVDVTAYKLKLINKVKSFMKEKPPCSSCFVHHSGANERPDCWCQCHLGEQTTPKDNTIDKIRVALDEIINKKFPRGERKWCIECAKRIKKSILSTLKDK